MSLTPEILTIYILDIVFLFFATLAFYLSIKITLKFDREQNTQEQYQLQKQSYLAATIIKFIFFIKVPLFVFFVFTLDKISDSLVGAMCAAGVVNATEYGVPLLILKMINLYIFAFWLTLNDEDMKTQTQKYFSIKFWFFIFAFVLLLIEIVSEYLMFSNIDINSVVDCCGVIFSVTDATYISEILSKEKELTLVFYALYVVLLIGYTLKKRYLFGVGSLLFAVIAVLSLISFFGTYIYELPTHHCPFCILQKEYGYIGYFLYIFLFFGTFYGISVAPLEYSSQELQRRYKMAMLFISLYVAIVSYYVLSYYFKNGVLLS